MIDIFDKRTMLAVLETIYPVNTFLRDRFFTHVENVETEHVDIDIVKGKRRMAPFVHPRMPGRVVSRDGYQTKTYTPPLLNPKTVTTVEHIIKRSPGETIYGNEKGPQDRAAEIFGKDLASLNDQIDRREEWMAAQALFTGKIHVKGDGVDEVIDFGHTQKTTLTGSVMWNGADADPLVDLARWRKTCIQSSGISPDIAILASNVADIFMNNPKLLKLLDNRRVVLGQINPHELPNGVTYIGYIGGNVNMDLYTYDEWYLDDEDGAEHAMVPDGKVLIASTKARLTRAYGAYIDVTDGGSFTVNAVPRYPRTYVEKDPPARYLQVCSRPLLIPHQIDSYYVATVL